MADAKMVRGQHNPFVNQLLEQAGVLDEEKQDVMKQIAANRINLRAMRTQGLLSDDQASAIAAFYPDRERKVKGTKTNANETFATKEARANSKATA